LQIATSVRIWPKGTFSFSSQKGFSGEASRVDLRTEARQRKSLKQSRNSSRETATGSATRWQASAKQEGNSLKVFRWQSGWLWWLAGLGLLAFLAWKLRWKIV